MTLSRDPFSDGTVAELDYSEMRSVLADGDLLLCSGSLTFSKMIQVATKSIWSHVGFIIRLPRIDRLAVLESVESIGVRMVALSSYIRDYNGSGSGYPGRLLIARHAGMATKQLDMAFGQFALDLMGYPYHPHEIAQIAFLIASGGLAREPSFAESKRFICSEYVHTCYSRLGVQIQQGDTHFVSPADFANDPDVTGICIPVGK